MNNPRIEELLKAADRPRELRPDELIRLRAGLQSGQAIDASSTHESRGIDEMNGAEPKRPPKTWRNYGMYLAAAALIAVAGLVGVIATSGGDESGLTTVDLPPEPTPTAQPTVEPTVQPTPEPTPEPSPEPEPTASPAPIQGLPDGVAGGYAGTRLLMDPSRPPEPAAGGAVVNVLGSFTANDGTEILVRVQVLDLRAEGGVVECGGQIYEGPWTMDTNTVSTGVVEIVGIGKMNVRFDHSLLAAEESGEPICEQNTGTWTGFSGDLEGRVGTIERLRVDREATWTIE